MAASVHGPGVPPGGQVGVGEGVPVAVVVAVGEAVGVAVAEGDAVAVGVGECLRRTTLLWSRYKLGNPLQG